MFNVEQPLQGPSDTRLAENNQLAVEGVDERISGQPRKGRRRRVFKVVLTGAAKKEKFPSWAQEGLKRIERPCFDPHSANGNQIDRFVEFGSWKEFLESGGLNLGVAEREGPNGFAQEHGFARLDFDHPQAEIRTRKLERDRWRAAAGSRVEQSSSILGDISRCHHGLDQEAIDRIVLSLRRQPEGGEVDLRVPLGQELVVRLEILGEGCVERDSCRSCPASQPISKLTTRHASNKSHFLGGNGDQNRLR